MSLSVLLLESSCIMSAVSKSSRVKVNGRKRQSRSSRSNADFVTKREVHGGRFTPLSNPPDVTYQPWHPVTLVYSFSGNKEIKVTDISSQLKAQVDPTKRGFNPATTGDGRFVIQFRMFAVQAWNLTGRVISLSAEDFIDHAAAEGGRDQLCGLVDTGSSIHTPAVGYKFPASVSAHVVRTDDKFKDTYLINIQSGPDDRIIAYVKILYRFDGPVKAPTIFDHSAYIARGTNEIQHSNASIENSIEVLIETLQNTNDLLAKIDEAQPSTTSKIINGVSQAVMLVTSVADALSSSNSYSDVGEEVEIPEYQPNAAQNPKE